MVSELQTEVSTTYEIAAANRWLRRQDPRALHLFKGRHANPGFAVNAGTGGLVIGDAAGQLVVTADIEK